jgi:hypothetical protein
MALDEDPLQKIANSLSNLERMFAEELRHREQERKERSQYYEQYERRYEKWEAAHEIWEKERRTAPWATLIYLAVMAVLVGLSMFLASRLIPR